MSSSITLVTPATNPAEITGWVGLLCELACDSPALAKASRLIPLPVLIGDRAETKAKAFSLARKLLDGEPRHRGVQQLGIFEEMVIRELQLALHAVHLDTHLTELGSPRCRIPEHSQLTRHLVRLREASFSADPRSRGSTRWSHEFRRIKKYASKVRELGVSSLTTTRVLKHLPRVFDPVQIRSRGGLATAPNWEKGAIWYYSTAATFSATGLQYEPFFPGPFNYMIENTQTGGAPLLRANRPFTTIYDFGAPEFVPEKGELSETRGAIDRHIATVPLEVAEERAVRLFLESDFYAEFRFTHLPRGLYTTSAFERWAEMAAPRALVAGNPAFEGYALHAARKRAIPTVLLQHGAFGDFRQFSDPPCGTYVVQGEFWRDFLAPAPRRRARILFPRTKAPARADRQGGGRSILFLTAPVSMLPFFHRQNLDDILLALLLACHRAGRPLTVRVHPLEDVDDYRSRVGTLARQRGFDVDVAFRSGTPLEDDIAGAAAAVLYFSTVFQDCMAASIPIISIGWHEYPFKSHLQKHAIFHDAADLAELTRLVEAAAAGALAPAAAPLDLFQAATPHEELRHALAEAIRPQSGGRV